jgi:hypothetical protein
MNGYERVIAILVDRLGGDVTINDIELADTRIELEMQQHPTAFAYKLRTHREPIVSEVVAEIIGSAVPLDEYFAARREIKA